MIRYVNMISLTVMYTMRLTFRLLGVIISGFTIKEFDRVSDVD